jgi:F420-non-reducing hydrogenase iron-sulfur subunit
MRLQYPIGIRVVRVPCTGKVDVLYILHAFEKGADGVYLVGCLEGGCHYNSGNIKARNRVEQARKILDVIGVGGQRVEMYNLSSSDGPLFADYATEMNGRIQEMGPNPIKLARKKQAA